MGTLNSNTPWKVNLKKFRVYLREKYGVEKAYYFVGAYEQKHKKLYLCLEKNGYLVVLREHANSLVSKKKGNVDTDIVFSVMRGLVEKEDFDKVILVSGDGDYWKMVNYLILKKKFAKILVPGVNSVSSLYLRKMADSYISFLDSIGIKKKISA